MDFSSLIDDYNNGIITMEQIAKDLNCSERTAQRRFISAGYEYSKKTKKYYLPLKETEVQANEKQGRGRPREREIDENNKLKHIKKLTVEIDKDVIKTLHIMKLDGEIDKINTFVEDAIREKLANFNK